MTRAMRGDDVRMRASLSPSPPSLPPICVPSSLLRSLRHRASSTRADTTTARAPPSRERVVVLDRAASVACADRLSRLARAAVAAAPSAPTPLCVPSSLLLLASPRQLNESRHDDRESAAEPRASRRS